MLNTEFSSTPEFNYLTSLLNNNSIVSLRNYINNHPNKKIITKNIVSFLQNSMLNPQASSDDLKLKAWFMIPKSSRPSQERVQQILKKSPLHISPALKHELVENLFLPSEVWRLKEIQALGIELDPTDRKKLLFDEVAKEKPNIKVIKFILESGDNIDLNEKNFVGNTLLHTVLTYPQVNNEVIKLLIQFGANPRILNDQGNTPLHMATLNPCVDEKMIGFLLLAGSNVSQKNNLGQTPIHTAILLKPPNLEIIQKLIQSGVDLSLGDKAGDTPLHYAAKIIPPRLDLIELLWMWGADLDVKNKEGQTPLHLASMVKPTHPELIERLLLYGADVNSKDLLGNIPLHWALTSFPVSSEALDLLVKNESDLFAINKAGQVCSTLLNFKPSNLQALLEFNEMHYRKLLANSWGISKGHFIFRGEIVPLEKGTLSEGQGHLSRLLEIFEKLKANQSVTGIFDLYKRSIKNGKAHPNEFLKKYNKGEPFSFPVAFTSHLMEVTIYKNYLMISNRGLGKQTSSVHVFKIDRKSHPLTINIISKLREIASREKGIDFFYRELPDLLGYDPNAKPDFVTNLFNLDEHQKPQKMNNCWWVSQKAGIFAFSAIEAIDTALQSDSMREMSEQKKDTYCRSFIKAAEGTYKQFSEFTRIQILIEYLQNLTPHVPRDHELVKQVIQKTLDKNWQYIFQSGSFSKDKLFELVDRYKKFYHLDSDFKSLPMTNI